MQCVSRALCVIFLIFSLYSLPSPALSFPLNYASNSPEYVARLHCRLMLFASQPGKKLDVMTFMSIGGQDGLNSYLNQDELDVIVTYLGLEPEMDFIIGTRWQSFSREERKAFNQLMTQYLIAHYDMQVGASLQDDCLMDVQSVLDPVTGRPVAFASTILAEDAALKVIYQLERLENGQWVISDLSIQGSSVVQTFQAPFNAMLSSKGAAEFFRWLESEFVLKQHDIPGDKLK